jgi:hypothetical protein
MRVCGDEVGKTLFDNHIDRTKELRGKVFDKIRLSRSKKKIMNAKTKKLFLKNFPPHKFFLPNMNNFCFTIYKIM